MNYNALSQALTELKKQEGTQGLQEVSSVPLQQSLRHLEKAMSNFFEKRAKYPKDKKKHNKQSATYVTTAFVWTGSTLTLAKQKEPLTIVWARPLPKDAKPSSVTISKDKAGRSFISIFVEEEIATLPPRDTSIGIDLVLKSFLTTSEGETIDTPKYYACYEKKLAKLERKKGAQGSDPSHTGLLEPLTDGSFAHSKGMCNTLLFPPLLLQIPGTLASPFAHLSATHADQFSALVVSQFGRKYSEYFLPGTNPSCLSIYFPPTRGLAYSSEEMDTVQTACGRGVAAPSWRMRPATSQTCHKFEVLPLTRRTKCICATDIGVPVGGRP